MATINDIGIPGVGTGILQPKRKNLWRVTFGNLGGGVNTQPVSMQAISIERPKLEFAEIPLHRYNSVAWVGGKHTWSEISMIVQDDVSGTATQVIQAQLQKQQWLIGAEGQWLAVAGEGSQYKFVTYLDLLDGNQQVIENWTIEGCWFKSANWDTMEYATSDPVQITLSIRYDHARQQVGGYTQGQGVATGGPGKI